MVTDMVVLFEPIQPHIHTSLPPLDFLEFKWLYGFFTWCWCCRKHWDLKTEWGEKCKRQFVFQISTSSTTYLIAAALCTHVLKSLDFLLQWRTYAAATWCCRVACWAQEGKEQVTFVPPQHPCQEGRGTQEPGNSPDVECQMHKTVQVLPLVPQKRGWTTRLKLHKIDK